MNTHMLMRRHIETTRTQISTFTCIYTFKQTRSFTHARYTFTCTLMYSESHTLTHTFADAQTHAVKTHKNKHTHQHTHRGMHTGNISIHTSTHTQIQKQGMIIIVSHLL